MNTSWTFKLFPYLPEPPAQLVENIKLDYRPIERLFSPDDPKYLGIQKVSDWKKQSYDWIKPMASNNNKRYRFDPEFTDWIQNNISTDFQASNSGVMFFDEPQLPHTDLTRDFVLLYNLKTGGPAAKVCFWKEKNHPLYRERMLAVEKNSQLQLVDEIQGPENIWYLMNTRIIHSVENVQSLRLNLQISFDTVLPKKFNNNRINKGEL